MLGCAPRGGGGRLGFFFIAGLGGGLGGLGGTAPRGVEDAAPCKQLPVVMLRVDASIGPYKQRGKI